MDNSSKSERAVHDRLDVRPPGGIIISIAVIDMKRGQIETATTRGTNMRCTFADLIRFLDVDPARYRFELERMMIEDPARLDRFVDYVRKDLAEANETEDRPLTDTEVDDLIAHTAAALGWSKNRVMSEAITRLRAVALFGEGEFQPVTPSEDISARRGTYLRRRSSIKALLLGDLRANGVSNRK